MIRRCARLRQKPAARRQKTTSGHIEFRSDSWLVAQQLLTFPPRSADCCPPRGGSGDHRGNRTTQASDEQQRAYQHQRSERSEAEAHLMRPAATEPALVRLGGRSCRALRRRRTFTRSMALLAASPVRATPPTRLALRTHSSEAKDCGRTAPCSASTRRSTVESVSVNMSSVPRVSSVRAMSERSTMTGRVCRSNRSTVCSDSVITRNESVRACASCNAGCCTLKVRARALAATTLAAIQPSTQAVSSVVNQPMCAMRVRDVRGSRPERARSGGCSVCAAAEATAISDARTTDAARLAVATVLMWNAASPATPDVTARSASTNACPTGNRTAAGTTAISEKPSLRAIAVMRSTHAPLNSAAHWSPFGDSSTSDRRGVATVTTK